MDLNVVWFCLISILFIGFFFLEGFDFGVGILLPFVAKKDDERRVVINTIGPFWDGNEVWLITAGGAIFAAFPMWYATMFSGFYLALLLALVALILRGVSFEFRSKKESAIWKKTWDSIIFGTSLVLAIVWAVALANLVKGVPIDKTFNYVGGFFDLFSLFTLMAGIMALVFFIFHGATFLSLKTKGVVEERAYKVGNMVGLLAIIISVVLIGVGLGQTSLFDKFSVRILSFITLISLCLTVYLFKIKKFKVSLILNGVIIALTVASLFIALFPNVMVSSIDPSFNLTIYNAASSHYTLSLMTKVAITLVPIVLLYQGWTFWIFRKRVTSDDIEY